MNIFASLLLVAQISSCLALPSFPNHVPNGNKVFFDGGLWLSLGHKVRQDNSPSKGAGLNPFGRHVAENLVNGIPNWKVICKLDSDGDGLTNGEELLDPTCMWTSSDDDHLLVNGTPSHPGFAPDEVPETPTKIKIHAAFMTLAWLFFAPIGILTAVVLKVKTKSVTAVNWFKIHKVCVGTAVYLTMIAYVCMVYEREEFLFINAHTRVGHAVVILAIIQPLSGFWRIHINSDGSKSTIRLAWEYFHQNVGRALMILAVVALYLGYEAQGFIEDATADGMKGLAIAMLVVGGLFAFVWVFVRTDERKLPDLPTKQETKPPVAQEAKKEEPGKQEEEKQKTNVAAEKAKELADQAKKAVAEGAVRTSASKTTEPAKGETVTKS